MFFGRWCRRFAAHFNAIGAFYATARVNAARFSAVGCRRYAAHFTSVDATIYATTRVNVARFTPLVVGAMLPIVGAMLPILVRLVPLFTQRRG